jgi:hypothetical protein
MEVIVTGLRAFGVAAAAEPPKRALSVITIFVFAAAQTGKLCCYLLAAFSYRKKEVAFVQYGALAQSERSLLGAGASDIVVVLVPDKAPTEDGPVQPRLA